MKNSYRSYRENIKYLKSAEAPEGAKEMIPYYKHFLKYSEKTLTEINGILFGQQTYDDRYFNYIKENECLLRITPSNEQMPSILNLTYAKHAYITENLLHLKNLFEKRSQKPSSYSETILWDNINKDFVNIIRYLGEKTISEKSENYALDLIKFANSFKFNISSSCDLSDVRCKAAILSAQLCLDDSLQPVAPTSQISESSEEVTATETKPTRQKKTAKKTEEKTK